MRAVWMRARAELRRNLRAWMALALALGLAGGLATAAAAGARRTMTAYPRFYDAHAGAHVVTGGLGDVDTADIGDVQRRLGSLPQVEAFGLWRFLSDRFELANGRQVVFPEALVAGDETGKLMHDLQVPMIVRGRTMSQERADEALVDLAAANRLDIDVGDLVTVLLYDPATFEPTVRRQVRIVGVALAPGGVAGVGESLLQGISVTAAFIRENAASLPPAEDGPVVRLRSEADIASYVAAARRIAPTIDIPVTSPRHIAGVQRMLRYDASALWILAALLALVSIAVLGLAISRQLATEAAVHRTLAAIGMSRAQLITGDLLRVLIAAGIGGLLTVPVAIALSPLTPRGIAGLLEPSPGIWIDTAALSIGAGATLLASLAAAVIPAARLARRQQAAVGRRTSIIATALSRAGTPPSALVGVRMALDPGRGTRAVPVRAAVGGMAIAIAAVAAAMTFGASFSALIDRPELYGFTWDVLAGSDDPSEDARILDADPDVVAAPLGGYGNVRIEGRDLLPLVYPAGAMQPTMLEGRAPSQRREIALGTSLMRKLNVRIGGTVQVSPEGESRKVPFEVVGRVVVPPVFFRQVEPGESTAMTLEALRELNPSGDELEELPRLIRYRKGTDVRAKVTALRVQIPNLFVAQVREPGAELSALSRSADLPVVLTLALMFLALGTLLHTLVLSIRRRRGDLAVLKSLGFVRGQVRAAVAWQASTLVTLALLLGVPVGIAAGRWGWRWFADTIGVVPQPTSPLILAMLALPAAAVLLANLIALAPGRHAARMSPAEALRIE